MLASDHNQSILISSIANYTWPCGQRFPISQGDRKWRLHAASLASIQVGKTITLDRLIEAGAWADAAITLVGFELPNWRLRRLVYEDDEWLCSLSRQPNLPIFLDKPAEGSHAVLALAVLRAFVAARCTSAAIQQVTASVPRVRPRPAFVFCCDNLA
jgi:hypothetical protein